MSDATPRLVAFDLDDTLAPSKSAIDPRIGELLLALAERVECGHHLRRTAAAVPHPVVERLPEASPELLSQFHLMPTCGTQYYRLTPAGIETVYAHSLTDDEKQRALSAVREEAERLGLWEPSPGRHPRRPRCRRSRSPPSASRPLSTRRWRGTPREKKNSLREAVAARIPDLEVRSGGSTSVDITHRGIDNAYGMGKLADTTGIPLDDMLFVGDRLDPTATTTRARDGRHLPGRSRLEDTAAFLSGSSPRFRSATGPDFPNAGPRSGRDLGRRRGPGPERDHLPRDSRVVRHQRPAAPFRGSSLGSRIFGLEPVLGAAVRPVPPRATPAPVAAPTG